MPDRVEPCSGGGVGDGIPASETDFYNAVLGVWREMNKQTYE